MFGISLLNMKILLKDYNMKGIFKGLNFMILIAKKFLNMLINFCIRKKHYVYNPSKKNLSVFEYLSDPNLLTHKFYLNKSKV